MLTVEGHLRPGPAGARRVASRLAATGVELRIDDGRGRRLAAFGPSVRSPLGRALLGTARARPTPRGLVAALRGAAADTRGPTDPEGET